MIIKIHTISSSHGAAAINYAMAKESEKAADNERERKKVIRPIFLGCRNIDTNPLTGEPTSPLDVYQQMRLQEAASSHKVAEPIFRMELRPPVEECRDWSLEQWQQFDRDCEEAIASIDRVPVYNKKTKRKEWRAVRPLDLSKAQVVTAKHEDTDPHLHKIVNRHTVDGKVLSSHYCALIGIEAANRIAEKYGWTKAEDRPNQRKERIYRDAMEALKSMEKFDIEAYFSAMREKGWIVDAKYNAAGRAVRYRIGEIPNGSKNPVLYGSSEIGKGRHLTVGGLYKMWGKIHPEKEWEISHRWSGGKVTQKSVERTAPMGKMPTQERPQSAAMTDGGRERTAAINKAHQTVKSVLGDPWHQFTPRDLEDILPAGIVAQAIEKHGTAIAEDNRKEAATDFVSVLEDSFGRANEVLHTLFDEVLAYMAGPAIVPSGGGGGGGQSTSPKQKDEEWSWWKGNAFGFRQPRRKGISK